MQLDPTARHYVRTNGELTVKLKRALYGCVQSARLWYDRLRAALEGQGFVVNQYDMCVFNRMVEGKRLSVAFHVDDLLVTCVEQGPIDEMVRLLLAEFEGVSEVRGGKHSYLAMNLELSDEYYTLDMAGYLKKILVGREGRGVKTPAAADLCKDPVDSPLLDAKGQKDFHSDVATILFIAKRVRMECLTAVSVLASRVNVATDCDRDKLDRVFSYLAHTEDVRMRFRCGGDVDLTAYVDASWATHDDGHGRTGIVLMMAGCAVAAWSSKQKMVTRSSTESEIVALSDATTQIMWYRRWLAEQGYDVAPYQSVPG